MQKDIKVCIVGIWHLGSVISVCLSDLGYQVVGYDRDLKKVTELNNGVPPIFEPGLSELLMKNIRSKRLTYTTDLGNAVKGSRYIIIAFDTRVDEKDDVDLSEIFETITDLSSYLDDDSLIIMSSQVPIGTCEQIKTTIMKNHPNLNFDVALVPENLRLGQAIERYKHPEMLVIGADNPSTVNRVEEFFSAIECPKIRMNLRTAEMVKHALNAFFATSVGFICEIGNLCDKLGADAVKVSTALKMDERIGSKAMLRPGLGFSGGTLARDMKILQRLGDELGYETPLIDGVLKVNEQQNQLISRRLESVYGSLRNLVVGVLGLTYKAGTSTLRRSAALEIIKSLKNGGATVKAYDPKASLEEVMQHREFEFCPDPYTVARDSDALVIVTDWPEFNNLDFDLIRSLMKKPVIVDTRNMLDNEQLTARGFLYFGIGRGQML